MNENKAYLAKLQKRKPQLIEQMESYAASHQIPIIDSESFAVMLMLLKIKNPTKILEIGTAIGYSAIRIAQELPQATVVSIEQSEEMFAKAGEFISEAGLAERIQVVFGDALECSEKVTHYCPFDALFIDAAKGQYKAFFDLYSKMVKPGGVVVSDNVLFRGYVASSSVPPKRFRRIVNKLREYNHYLAKHLDFDTTFLSVGDGIAVSLKK